jgi:glycine/D-amino acid oxidase-like deaminating enzyme
VSALRRVTSSAGAPDVAVIGGGIVGCAVAAFAAEDGARVRLYEGWRLAAGASGRNSGLVQHPLDAGLTGLFEASVALYRELGHGFSLPRDPAGVLFVGEDAAALEPVRAAIARDFPELVAEPLAGAELHAAEPGLARDLAAFRLHTGYPVPPAAATEAFAARARAAGAELLEGVAARPEVRAGRVEGVRTDAGIEPAGVVVVAAGPWSSELVDPSGAWQPIAPLWGVNVELRLGLTPRHALEQPGIETLTGEAGLPGTIFSLVTHDGVSALGSTFLADEPDAAALAPVLLERGTRFVPDLPQAAVVSVRACARPLSVDGRPLLGPAGDADGLLIAAGHGPWGVSLGPQSARLVADTALGRYVEIPAALQALRLRS